MNQPLMPSKPTDERATPQALFDQLNRLFGPFELDVCATAANSKCYRCYTAHENGLIQPWADRNWMNPPYSRGEQYLWVERAVDLTIRYDQQVAALLPADTSTRLWHDLVLPCASAILYIKGRVRFNGSKTAAKFGSALALFGYSHVELKRVIVDSCSLLQSLGHLQLGPPSVSPVAPAG